MKDRVALFGLGSIGTPTLREWVRAGAEVLYVIDSNPVKSEIVNKLRDEVKQNIQFINTDILKDPLPEEVFTQPNIWSISTNTDSHAAYLLAALEKGIPRIWLEKPSTDNPATTEKILGDYQDRLVQVNYVERGHSVVRTIKDHMVKTGFKPEYFFHWRSKDLRQEMTRKLGGGRGSRIALEDLVHDISEVDYLDNLGKHDVVFFDSAIRSWLEKDPVLFPYSTDVDCEFELWLDALGSDGKRLSGVYVKGPRIRIRGSFADQERRYFVVTGKDSGDRSIAYFGQTLSREHIKPIAAVVYDEHAKNLLELAECGIILNQAIMERLLEDLKAEELNRSAHPYSGILALAKNLIEARYVRDLKSPLKTALKIERIIEGVYIAAGIPQSMIYEELPFTHPERIFELRVATKARDPYFYNVTLTRRRRLDAHWDLGEIPWLNHAVGKNE